MTFSLNHTVLLLMLPFSSVTKPSCDLAVPINSDPFCRKVYVYVFSPAVVTNVAVHRPVTSAALAAKAASAANARSNRVE
jgi:hypothetical protein